MKMTRLCTCLLCLFSIIVLEMSSVNQKHGNLLNCSKSQHVGVMREQKIAMDMAIDDICRMTNNRSCPVLRLNFFQGNSAQSVYDEDVSDSNILGNNFGWRRKELGNGHKDTPVRPHTSKSKELAHMPTGSSIEVAVKQIRYSLFYVFVPYKGTYADLVAQVYSKTLDAVVGDIDIIADRYKYVDFSQPCTESGVSMVVPVQRDTIKDVFNQFFKLSYDPDTKETYVTGFSIEMLDDVMKQLHYWPFGTRRTLIDEIAGRKNKPLKIGVPAEAVFDQFVKVSYDQKKNKTYVSGLSIQVFEAIVKQLPYSLSYVLVPYKGTYDDLVANVYNKNLDMGVGDIEITADRYKYAEFSQPYMESSLVMVVPVKKDTMKDGFIFLYAFTTKMWIILLVMTVGTISVVWFNEHVHRNADFEASSTVDYIIRMLWFAVAVLSLSHRELIKNNLSRLVLATWFCVNTIVAVCFTAALSSIITAPRFHPSLDRHNINYVVGCNGNSFINRYLVDVLQFSPRNIRHVNSIEDYHEAFKKGVIFAAYFESPHANVFLAKYCEGYEKIGPIIKLGGFGFVFQKGSTLTGEISEAVLKVRQTGEINILEENMLSSFSKCSQNFNVPRGLDPRAFTGLFMISGCISAFVFITTLSYLVAKREYSVWDWILSKLITTRVGRWLTLLLIKVVYHHPGAELTSNQAIA